MNQTINIIGDVTILLRVENDAAALGRAQADAGGPAEATAVPEVAAMIRGISAPLADAVTRGYARGHVEALRIARRAA